MPTDVDALLAYGYDLGGPGRWRLRGVDSDLESVFPWWNSTTGEHGEFDEAAMDRINLARKLQTSIDVTGIRIVWYGSDTRHSVGIGYILSAVTHHSYFSGALALRSDDLREDGRCDQRLGHALDALGIQPQQLGPQWILAASHGI
jgi:hypothetical protein